MQPTLRTSFSGPPSSELPSSEWLYGPTFVDLPLDLLNEILSFLPYPFVHLVIGRVCSELYHLIRAESKTNDVPGAAETPSRSSLSLHCLRNIELRPLLTLCALESCPGSICDLALIRCRLLYQYFKDLKQKRRREGELKHQQREEAEEDPHPKDQQLMIHPEEDEEFCLAISILEEQLCGGSLRWYWSKAFYRISYSYSTGAFVQAGPGRFHDQYLRITSGDLLASSELRDNFRPSFWRSVDQGHLDQLASSSSSSSSCVMQQLPLKSLQVSGGAMKRFVLERLHLLDSLCVSPLSSSEQMDSRCGSIDARIVHSLTLMGGEKKEEEGDEEDKKKKKLGVLRELQFQLPRLWECFVREKKSLRLQKLKVEGVAVHDPGLFVKALQCLGDSLIELRIRDCYFEEETCRRAFEEGNLPRHSVEMPHLVHLELRVIDKSRMAPFHFDLLQEDRSRAFQSIDETQLHSLGFLLPLFVCDNLEHFEFSGIVGEEKLQVNLVETLVIRESDNFGLSDEVLQSVRNLTIVRHDERVKGVCLFEPETICSKFLGLESLSIDHELGLSSGFVRTAGIHFTEREKVKYKDQVFGRDWGSPMEKYEEPTCDDYGGDYEDYEDEYYGDYDDVRTPTPPPNPPKLPSPPPLRDPPTLPTFPYVDPKPYDPKCSPLTSIVNYFHDDSAVHPHLTSINLSGSEVTDSLLLLIAERYSKSLREAVFSNYDDVLDPIANFRYSLDDVEGIRPYLREHRDDHFATRRALTVDGVTEFLVQMQVNLETLILPLVYSVCQRSFFAGVVKRYHLGAALSRLEVWGYLFNSEVVTLIRSVPVEIVVHGGKLSECSEDDSKPQVFTWRCPMKCGAMGDEMSFHDALLAKRKHFETCAQCLMPLKSLSLGLTLEPRGYDTQEMRCLRLPEDEACDHASSLAHWRCPINSPNYRKCSYSWRLQPPSDDDFNFVPPLEELPGANLSDVFFEMSSTCPTSLPVAGLAPGEKNDHFTNCKANVVLCGSCGDPPVCCKFSELQQHLESEECCGHDSDSPRKVLWSVMPRRDHPGSLMTRRTKSEIDKETTEVIRKVYSNAVVLEASVEDQTHYAVLNLQSSSSDFQKLDWEERRRILQLEREQARLRIREESKNRPTYLRWPARCFGSLHDEMMIAGPEAQQDRIVRRKEEEESGGRVEIPHDEDADEDA